MKLFKKIGLFVIGMAVTLMVGLSIRGNLVLETRAADETYTYTTGDGTWVTTGSIRTYDIGNFIMTSRKNDSAINIPASYPELRIYEEHSLEIVPKDLGTKYITAVEVVASLSNYATAMGNATVTVGPSSATAANVTGISSVSESIALFNFTEVSNCEFVKFTLGAQTRTLSWKISYVDAGDSTAEASLFAVSFNFFISDICDANGNTYLVDLNTEWEIQKTAYLAMTEESKYILTSSSANATGSDIEKCVAKYVYIANKYALEDFMGRAEVAGANHVNEIVDNNIIIMMIIVVSLIGASISFDYCLVNKKKEN